MSTVLDGKKIRDLRQRLPGSPSVRQFSSRIGISYVTLSKIETGKAGASNDMIKKISDGLGCRPRDIELWWSTPGDRVAETTSVLKTESRDARTGEKATSYFSPTLNVIEVPIVGRVAASGIDYAPDEPPRGTTPFPLYGPARGGLEALVVAGDSMEPTAPDGSYVILKSRDFFRSGNMAVVRVDGQVLLKRVKVEGDVIILESDNKKHKPCRFSAKKVEILATVHQIVIVREP